MAQKGPKCPMDRSVSTAKSASMCDHMIVLCLHEQCPGVAYILKAKKFAEPPFQSKKIAEKVWVLFGPFWVILGHSWAIWGHLGSYLGHFGPFWVIFGHFWAILWHFWTNLRKVQFFCGILNPAILAFRMYALYVRSTIKS